MNNQWNNSQFQQVLASEASQVKMFDPTHFQAPAAVGIAQASRSVPQAQHQNTGAPPSKHVPPAQVSPSSRNSWSSWNWNSENNSTWGEGNQQQDAAESVIPKNQQNFDERVAETNFYGGDIPKNQQSLEGKVADSGFYGSDQYLGMGNSDWEHADQQHQTYTEPDISTSCELSQQQPQPVHDFQQYGGTMFSQGQDSCTDQNQQNEPFFNGQLYDQFQQQGVDQGQVYQQDPEQYQGQQHPYYNQHYDGNTWATSNGSGQWASNYQEQQEIHDLENVGTVSREEHDLVDSQSISKEGLADAVSGHACSHVNVLTGPSFQVFDNDDDGTVSGLFGRDGDGDGDVQLDTQRHVHSKGKTGNDSSSGLGQFLTVTPSFHRTNSEISNASLLTLNQSIEDDDDNGQEHNLQELVQRMEEVNLAQGQSAGNNKNTDNQIRDRMSDVPHLDPEMSFDQGSSADLEHVYTKGDYSGFGNSMSNHSPLHSSLPLDTDVRASSPVGDQPSSAESGGSSGLADWEIVHPHGGPVTHNLHNTLDSNAAFFSDKPDGGIGQSLANLDIPHQISQELFVSAGIVQPQGVSVSPQHISLDNNVALFSDKPDGSVGQSRALEDLDKPSQSSQNLFIGAGIIQPHGGFVTHNQHNSLDNNVALFSDKPDGSVGQSRALEDLDKPSQSSQNLFIGAGIIQPHGGFVTHNQHNSLDSNVPLVLDKSDRGLGQSISLKNMDMTLQNSQNLFSSGIVEPQGGSVTHNSLNNFAFSSEKPDGVVGQSNFHGNLGKPSQSSHNLFMSAASDQNVRTGSQNFHSSHYGASSISSLPEAVEPLRDTRGRSGSPFVAAFTDHRHEEPPLLPSAHISSLSPLISSLKTNSNLTTSVLPPEGRSANSPKRVALQSLPRQASVSQSTHQVPPSSILSMLPAENKAATTAPETINLPRSHGVAQLPSKQKLLTSSITEDGTSTSKRNSDITKSVTTTPAQIKQVEEPPARSSSRNSEEIAVSGQQRRHHSAFHPVGRTRPTAMSPATTLWDNSEAPTYNILLAPAMPLIIPNLPSAAALAPLIEARMTISASKVVTAVESTIDKSKSKRQETVASLSVESRDDKRDSQNKSKEGRRNEDKNRSFDSLDEVDAVIERQPNRNYYNQRSDQRELSYSHDSYRQDLNTSEPDRPTSRSDRSSSRSDRLSSRSDRPSSRSDRSGQYHYDRTLNRTDGFPKDDPYRGQRGLYRDHVDRSYEERYERPRSRQDESHNSRPSSRSVQEVDRPRSRANYDHDRDYYYYKDRHRSYSYDNYGRHVDYYEDERDRYYRYYREKEARYHQGYHDEYYGAKHSDYYQQHQQLQQQQGRKQSGQEHENLSIRSQSRGSTPAIDLPPGIPPSQGIRPSSAGHGYYGVRSSHPDSRTDYGRGGYPYEGYGNYYDSYGYDQYAYGYGYPTYEEHNQVYEQGRLTPAKYSYPIVRACFGPTGQLIKVLPNRPADGQPAIVEIQDVQTALESCQEADELKQFPGPLTRTHTHKKDVLLFCQLKIRACADDVNMVDRESAQLLWRFLELLIKQNGSVVGTDLADLLLEGHEPSSHEYNMKISQSPEVLDTVPEGNSDASGSTRASPAVRVTSDRTLINTMDRERDKWIDRFRNLLLYGHKKDALECAMKHNLWGHALFLASKMDSRTHANVMTRFANGAIRMNDPLQTLYQLMSGRQPAAITCVVDDRWGDWRPHLAMILSNQTSRPDIDRKSITTLGDTLASKGFLYASHFCYLMAQVNFGSYLKKTSKIVLIGSSHNLPLEEFATNEAIQWTEVYEYAQSLGNPAFCLPHLQIFKYLYACRLADYGMASEALQYCEVIAVNIHQNPAYFHSPFVKLVLQLSTKLKFSDPQRQIAGEDVEDPPWLQQLGRICASYDDGSIQPLSGTATPAGFAGTTTSSESGEYNPYGYGYVADAAVMSTTSSAPVVSTYEHHTQEDGTGYSDGHDNIGGITGEVQSTNITTDQQHHHQLDYSQQQQYDYNQWQQQQYGYNYTDYSDQQQQLQQLNSDETTNEQQQFSQQQPQQQQTTLHQELSSAPASTAATTGLGDVGHTSFTSSTANPNSMSLYGGSQLDQSSSSIHTATSQHQLHGNFEEGQRLQPHQSVVSGSEAGGEDVTDGLSNSFDYFGNMGTQKVVAPPHRYRHMSGSSNDGNARRRRTISESSTGSVKASPRKPPPPQHQLGGGSSGGKVAKSGQQDNTGSGWFGGLLKKFKVKGKNEMILPDDKNPSIVWDPVMKKWINADGTAEEETPAAPPPKDADLMGGKPPGGSSNSFGPPPPSNNPGGNRFSLKAKGARNQYVDVTNPKVVSIPPSLLNVVPGGGPLETTNQNSAAAPIMFLPGTGQTADVKVTDSNNSNLDSSLMASLSSVAKPVSENLGSPAPNMPMLFNPANLKAGKGQASSSVSGTGFKVGQRRAYPK